MPIKRALSLCSPLSFARQRDRRQGVRLRDGIRVCIEVAAFCVVCVLFWLSTQGNAAAESDQLKTAVRNVEALVDLLRDRIPDHGLFARRVRLRAYHPLIRRLAHMSTTS